jgi:hypothetical protein
MLKGPVRTAAEKESRAFPNFALYFDVTAHRLNNPLTNCQSQAGSTVRRLSMGPPDEMAGIDFTRLQRYADTSVLNLEKHARKLVWCRSSAEVQ